MIADEVQQNIGIPLIHIAEATANEISERHIKKVALLGTRITMEQPFFKNKLAQNKSRCLFLAKQTGSNLHNAIFEELGKGIFTAETKGRFITIINGLIEQGAEGVILGCTEFLS